MGDRVWSGGGRRVGGMLVGWRESVLWQGVVRVCERGCDRACQCLIGCASI